MRPTKLSTDMIRYFEHQGFCHEMPMSANTRKIILQFYQDFQTAHDQQEDTTFSIETTPVRTLSDLPIPKTYSSKSFPSKILNHVRETAKWIHRVEFQVAHRNIVIFFITEKGDDVSTTKLKGYTERVMMWMYLLTKYASSSCGKTVTLYVYMTSLLKQLPPRGTNVVLDEMHVNTAYTTTCPANSEIVIFRKEEWLKVFFHETMHNFDLDFSGMDNRRSAQCIRSIFPVFSDVNFFEAYTEFWGEFLHILFCAYFRFPRNANAFVQHTHSLLEAERCFTLFQLVKVLDFMGLDYADLYTRSSESQQRREARYRERTNVLAYYVVKAVFMNDWNAFLMWCKKYNGAQNILQFKKTGDTPLRLCAYVAEHHDALKMTRAVKAADEFYERLLVREKKKRLIIEQFLLGTMRMTVCEFA